MEPLVETWAGGASFFVKAHAGARRDAVSGVHDGQVKVEVTTAPEKGRANRAIQKLLSGKLGVASSDVLLLSGETNQKKRFGVRGVTREELAAKLRTILC